MFIGYEPATDLFYYGNEPAAEYKEKIQSPKDMGRL